MTRPAPLRPIMLLVALASGCALSPAEVGQALSPGAPAPAPRPAAGSFTDGTYNGRNYKFYVPSGLGSTAIPLVVMLHGCTQTPADFAAGTRMNELAEANTFLVVYPEQSSSDNGNLCWNWFLPAHQARGGGEPADIVGIVDQVAGSYMVDATKVYAAGLSAGGAMSVILGATYPDRFSAISVAGALEYKAATTLSGALNAQASGGPAPATQGMAAYTAMGTSKKAVRVFVAYGTVDGTVAPVNGDQVLSQWAQTDDLASDGTDDDNITDVATATATGQVVGGRAYSVSTYDDKSTGKVVLQKLVVTDMDHAWSGGSNAGSFTNPTGPNASQLTWAFFSGQDAVTVLDGGVAPVDAGTSPADAAMPPVDVVTDDAGTTKPSSGGGCELGHGPSSLASVSFVLLALALRRRRGQG